MTFKVKFAFSPLQEAHNHHITTREPGVPRLLHGPDCFMVFILCMYLYTWNVSWSPLFHSLNSLHVYWPRQLRVFQHLTSLLFLAKHHELWSTSVNHPFPFLNASLDLTGIRTKCYQKIIPTFWHVFQNFALLVAFLIFCAFLSFIHTSGL